jgi:hypothetical protein
MNLSALVASGPVIYFHLTDIKLYKQRYLFQWKEMEGTDWSLKLANASPKKGRELNTSTEVCTRWRSWIRHCATSRKVGGSIPDGIIDTIISAAL